MVFYQAISEKVFREKYMINGETSIDQVFEGIAEKISSVEKNEFDRKRYKKIFLDSISEGYLLPGGRITANARPWLSGKCYNNCYVIPIEDSLEGIYQSLSNDAIISSSGGGVGFNISTLRPEGSPLLTKGGVSSGPLSFLRVFNESAKVIHTGGNRRSAHIAILNVDHPDIEKFITIKKGNKNNELTQFNISVGITQEFMKAVEDDLDWELKFKGVVYKTVKARYLYDLMVNNAYYYNEPGAFFLDTVNKFNNAWYLHKIEAPNPCGEIPQGPWNVCNLASLNLTKFVKNPFDPEAMFDFELFKNQISIGIRFLDNVVDATNYPLPEITREALSVRRLGLGITGLGDMLAMLRMDYGQTSYSFIETISKILRDTAYETSIEIAREKGCFPSFHREKYLQGNFIRGLPSHIFSDIERYGIRNVSCLAIAPTGTISLSLGNNCSSGIEPIFSLYYDRTIRTGRGEETYTETVYDYAYYLYKQYRTSHPEAEEKPPFFKVTMDIDPVVHIQVQAIMQKYIDSAISKTINLPKGYSLDNYKDLFLLAYTSELKGFTTFNPFSTAEGAIEGVLVHKETEKENEVSRIAPKRPKDLICHVYVQSIKGQKYLILVGILNNQPYEVFLTEYTPELKDQLNGLDTTQNRREEGLIRKGGKGVYDLLSIENGKEKVILKNISKIFNKEYEGPTRLVSTALRHGIPLVFIVDQLGKTSSFGTWAKTMSIILKKYLQPDDSLVKKVCPSCGSKNVIFQEGCLTCLDCNFSKCS